jgi:tetratricopeptide (TPR) repeat protein
MCRGTEQRFVVAILIAFALGAQSTVAIAQTPNQPVAGLPLQKNPVTEPKFQVSPIEAGDALMLHQRYQEAIESYRKAPQNSAEVWNKMGVAYQLMFNTDEAARCYQYALRLDGKNSVVLNNIGTLYTSQKRYGSAERMYRKALKVDPTSAVVHKNLGTALLAEHKYAKGWEAYQEAVKIEPTIFERTNSARIENPASSQERGAMNFYMAKGCARAGMNDKAIEYLRMALNEGFTSPKKIIADSEFAGLLNVPAFQQMLASQRAQ